MLNYLTVSSIVLSMLIVLTNVGCQYQDKRPPTHEVIQGQRPDKDLNGITFYVYGYFPDGIAGSRLTSVDKYRIELRLEAMSGIIATDPDDSNIDVVVLGMMHEIREFEDLESRQARLESENRMKYDLINKFQARDVEIISGEVLFSRLGLHDYRNRDTQDGLSRGAWDHLGVPYHRN